MNANYSDETIKVLNDLGDKLGVVVDWSSDNVIPYIQMIMKKWATYEIWSSVIWIIFGLLILGVAGIFYKYYKKDTSTTWNYAFMWIFIIIGVFIIMFQVEDIVRCVTFPEKLIINELLNKVR